MRLGQGRENAKQYLLDNADLMLEIETKVRDKSDELNMDTPPEEIAVETPPEEIAAAIEGEPIKKAAKKSKKAAILVEGAEDFEEFSPDEL
jgi:recombination protein RecA